MHRAVHAGAGSDCGSTESFGKAAGGAPVKVGDVPRSVRAMLVRRFRSSERMTVWFAGCNARLAVRILRASSSILLARTTRRAGGRKRASEQASKRASEQASKRASEQASKRAEKTQGIGVASRDFRFPPSSLPSAGVADAAAAAALQPARNPPY